MNQFFSPRTQVGIKAAREAGKIFAHIKEKGYVPGSIRVKGRNDFVTEVDERSEDIIVGIIKENYPADVIIAEESGFLSVDGEHEARWFIDPLDGTTNFIHGMPVFCISIAYEIDEKLQGGIVYDPNLDELFVAESGKGAYLNGTRIHVSEARQPGDSLLTTGFPFRAFNYLKSYFRLFTHIIPEIHGLRRPGSAALDLCWTACGRFEGFCELNLKSWDVAAGTVIVREAGGKVTDWYGREGFLETGNIVATNGLLHDWLLDKIAHHFLNEEIL